MGLDLSALEEKPTFFESTKALIGKPLELPLADIEEDPNQPRTEFNEAAMAEMVASIKARGVRQPVSVRPHPTHPNKWMLNFGARRFRASLRAGKETIPAFVDETSNDFDQVIENEQRDNLKPMELALFIQRKLEQGMKKADIARGLGKPAQIITEHLALIAAPACIEEAYREGKSTSPKTLYELRALHDKFPSQVEAWCQRSEEITRKAVANLAAKLKGTPSASPAVVTEPVIHHREPVVPTSSEVEGSQKSLRHDEDSVRSVAPTRLEVAVFDKASGEADSEELAEPLLMVEFEGQEAEVLLNRRPSSSGYLRIRYQDGTCAEVLGSHCKISLLTDRSS